MGKFVLYSYFRSSASHRVRIALNLKNIPYEYRAVHLLNGGGEQHTAEYRRINPSREVPTLIHEENVIGQSMAIVDYLDRVIPEFPLFPSDPFQRALVMQACEIANSGVQPLHNLRVLQKLEESFGADLEAKNKWSTHWITNGLESLETMLSLTSGIYSFGDQPTAADCFLIPHLANADRYQVSLKHFPALAKIKKSCETNEAFTKAAPFAQPDAPPT
jgi:maleylacetoacetate isomerase